MEILAVKNLYIFSFNLIFMIRLNWLFTVLLFFLVGELLIRFDMKTRLFEKDTVVKIATELGSSEEIDLLKENKIPLNDSVMRIMVLGDSYINGGGIDFNKNFSHQLKSLLRKSKVLHVKSIYVLDVTRPSNNNLDNYNTYFRFVKQFKPQIVILGYNLNDIKDNLEKKGKDSISSSALRDLPIKVQEKKNLFQRIYNFLWKSELIHFTTNNINKYLKSRGIIVHNSGFDEKINSYILNESNWVKSKELLSEMIIDANNNKITFILFSMPEIDLLEYPQLFQSVDKILMSFFGSFPKLIFVDGRDIFKGRSSKEFCLSKYDGHPNEKGHLFMAKAICDIIEKNGDHFK
jgi:hypothetical protein